MQICMDFQDLVQRSLQNPAEKFCRSAQIRKDRKPGVFIANIFYLIIQFTPLRITVLHSKRKTISRVAIASSK